MTHYQRDTARAPAPVITDNAGLASGRCDYKTTLGTLDFAAGEQAKFFQIFITDDAYVEGSESLLVRCQIRPAV